MIYTGALSRRTGLRLYDFVCAGFNEHRRDDIDHYSYQGDQWLLSFREKRNKVWKIPVSHDLQRWIDEYRSIEKVS